MKFGTGVHCYMRITILMFIFTKFLSLMFLGRIWSHNLDFFKLTEVSQRGDVICVWSPLTSHNWVGVDHIRLSFFQISIENLKRGPPSFQFFAYFMMFLTSSDLRTNHSAWFWVRGIHPVVPQLFWFAA